MSASETIASFELTPEQYRTLLANLNQLANALRDTQDPFFHLLDVVANRIAATYATWREDHDSSATITIQNLIEIVCKKSDLLNAFLESRGVNPGGDLDTPAAHHAVSCLAMFCGALFSDPKLFEKFISTPLDPQTLPPLAATLSQACPFNPTVTAPESDDRRWVIYSIELGIAMRKALSTPTTSDTRDADSPNRGTQLKHNPWYTPLPPGEGLGEEDGRA